ncbi:hypothetical protein RUMCAL_00782 [Ruminococcus callidus ATCC 27760]|uniref:Uncharacterized protein n=1 Tax=Ruminococcus callidus ATCC 27760 TaxID=411473 RepID=U2KXL1_9FIRM|nr:hypothetical protein RUMCAL_00782 [Ruminococcus callidus ATCC 27760]
MVVNCCESSTPFSVIDSIIAYFCLKEKGYKRAHMNFYGNTVQSLCVRCVVRFFGNMTALCSVALYFT